MADEPQTMRAAGRLQSFVHAVAGLGFLVRNEPNMRIHLGIGAVTVIAAIWLEVSLTEWRWLALAIALVLGAEALNTAVEQACNAITREHNPAIKAAKDLAAGAVLIAAIASALIGASIFAPHFLSKRDASIASYRPLICGELK